MHRHFLPKGYLIPLKFFTNTNGSPAALRRYILQLYPALEFLFLTEEAVPVDFSPSAVFISDSEIKNRLKSIVCDKYFGAFPSALRDIGTGEVALLTKHERVLSLARGNRDALGVDIVEGLQSGSSFHGHATERNATIYVASLILYHLSQKTLAGNPPLPSEGGDTEPPLTEQLSLDPIEALQPLAGIVGSRSGSRSRLAYFDFGLPTFVPEP